MIADPLIPHPRQGGFGDELAHFAAVNRSIARHRRQRRWLKLRAVLFGRAKHKAARRAALLKQTRACDCNDALAS
jgi:hypothetical protein